MLLTVTTTHQPATDLGFLLHKHPQKFQSFDLSFGKAHVYYPSNIGKRMETAHTTLSSWPQAIHFTERIVVSPLDQRPVTVHGKRGRT